MGDDVATLSGCNIMLFVTGLCDVYGVMVGLLRWPAGSIPAHFQIIINN